MTAGEAVLELAQLWESEAEVLRKRHADERAELLEQLAEEVREVVAARMSPWIPLARVQERTGWCAETLRDKANRLNSVPANRQCDRAAWTRVAHISGEVRQGPEARARTRDRDDRRPHIRSPRAARGTVGRLAPARWA